MRVGLGAIALTFFGSAALAQEAGPPKARDWLLVEGEARARYETLDGQFRANGTGGDQLLAIRNLLHIAADTGPVTLGVEFQDSRTYLSDEGTPLTSSVANPADILQLYARVDTLPGLLGPGSTSTLTLGRQTVSINSKRQIERVDYANVIKSYTGAHFTTRNERGDTLHALLVVPTRRFPSDRESLNDNRLHPDEEQWGRRIWGVHYRRADIAPTYAPGLAGEVFVYGLEEEDRIENPTPNRSYVAPGFRLHRTPRASQWDIDLEVALRKGERRASSSPDDVTDLDVDAAMTFAAFGYTFDAPWRPRIAAEYYFASGDENPNDGRFDQHERLFGSRRSDLNNTSIHGPLTPANLSAPGFRVEVTPNERWDGRFYYHAAYLDSATDAFVIARLRDPSGASGDLLGHTLDGRARYWIAPDRVRLEVGGSAFLHGAFTKNAPGAPDADRTLFGYAQVTVSF